MNTKYVLYDELKIFYKIDKYETYPPHEDSFLMTEYLGNIVIGKKVLDMGCGSGIQGIISKKYGSNYITFADIDRDALVISKYNYTYNFVDSSVTLNSLKEYTLENAEFILTDLFRNINKKYDLILFNPPYLPAAGDEDEKSKLWTAGGKTGNEIIDNFLSDAYKYLNNNGCILLLVSSLSNPPYILSKYSKLYKFKVVKKLKLFFEELILIELFPKF